MDKQRAAAILNALANGAHPVTGEVFAADSPYQHPDVVRALFLAIRILETKDTVVTAVSTGQIPAPAPSSEQNVAGRTQSSRQNAGKPWSAEEDRQLLASFDAGLTIKQLAEQHGRGASGIEARLVKLGRLELSPKLAATLRTDPTSRRVDSPRM